MACFLVCSRSVAAFAYSLSSAASEMMLSAGSLEILRECKVSSMSLGSSSSSAAENNGEGENFVCDVIRFPRYPFDCEVVEHNFLPESQQPRIF